MKFLWPFINLTLLTFSTGGTAANKVFCYFGSLAGERSGNGAFNVENINAKLCTHIAYSFIGLNTDGSVKLLDSGTLFSRFINLKNTNPNVKLLISMGGWDEDSSTYSAVARSASRRSKFVTSVFEFLNQHGFDGFDFVWEYPGLHGGVYEDKVNFITLLKDLKNTFGSTKILSAAVGATEDFFDTSYNVVEMNLYLDLINVMTFDYHSAYASVTGQTSPLYASSIDTNKRLNQNASITAWLKAGANPEKLLMGIALYGRSFTLLNINNNALGAPSSAGPAGPYTLEAGTLSYLEICEKLKSADWTTVFDDQQKTPYSFNGNQWIGYDNVQSVQIKTEYAINNNLAGIMVWSVDYEDHKNICGGGAYPLLNTINQVLSGEFASSTTTQVTTTQTATTQVTTTTQLTTTTTATTTLQATNPTTTKSSTSKPTTSKPTTSKPTTTKLTTRKTTTTKPTTTKPTTSTPTTTKPTTSKSTTTKPTTSKPTTTKPTTSKPTTTKLTTSKPTTTKPTTSKPTTTKPTTSKPTTIKPTTTKPTTSKPITIKPTTTKLTTTEPTTTKTTIGPTKPITNEFACTSTGTFRDAADCSVFYNCRSDGRGGYVRTSSKCIHGLIFDTLRLICNYAWAVKC